MEDPRIAYSPTTTCWRTPEQTLNFTRIVATSLLGIPILLTGVSWYLVATTRSDPSPLQPVWLAMLAIGIGEACLAPLIVRWMGHSAARSWAKAGRRGDEVAAPPTTAQSSAVFGLDLGPAPASARTTVWERFSPVSVAGCALPELALLMGFVVTFMTERMYIMLGSVVVFLVFWAIDFPRRSLWDEWAASAGLVLPWGTAPDRATADSPPYAPTPGVQPDASDARD